MIRVERMCLGALGTNCYLLYREDKEEVLIIDPAGEAEKIRNRLLQIGKKPAAILLTHGHFDHIGAVESLKESEHIPVCAQEMEADVLTDQTLNCCGMIGSDISARADRLLKDGEEISFAGITFQVIHTPGHTKGSCCYYCKEANMLFSGDTLFCQSYGRTDLPTGSAAVLIRSILNKLFHLPDQTSVFPGHGEETDIAFEKKYNPCNYYKDMI